MSYCEYKHTHAYTENAFERGLVIGKQIKGKQKAKTKWQWVQTLGQRTVRK